MIKHAVGTWVSGGCKTLSSEVQPATQTETAPPKISKTKQFKCFSFARPQAIWFWKYTCWVFDRSEKTLPRTDACERYPTEHIKTPSCTSRFPYNLKLSTKFEHVWTFLISFIFFIFVSLLCLGFSGSTARFHVRNLLQSLSLSPWKPQRSNNGFSISSTTFKGTSWLQITVLYIIIYTYFLYIYIYVHTYTYFLYIYIYIYIYARFVKYMLFVFFCLLFRISCYRVQALWTPMAQRCAWNPCSGRPTSNPGGPKTKRNEKRKKKRHRTKKKRRRFNVFVFPKLF